MILSTGVLPTLLQMNTDDPLRYLHRDLLSATMLSIGQEAKEVPDFKPFPGISPEDLVSDVSFHMKILGLKRLKAFQSNRIMYLKASSNGINSA